MPTGVKIITTLNIVLASLFVSNLLYLHKSAQSAPLLVFVNLVSAGTLILITLIVLLRLIRLVGFARVLAYALILVLVAVVVIAILTLLGPTIGNVFSNVIRNL